MTSFRIARLTPLVAALLVSACAAPQAHHQAAAPTPPPATQGPIEIGVIAINDFHGALEPPKQTVDAPDGKGNEVSVPAGGAAWLASAVDALKAEHPENVVVAAGDLTSASQLASSLYLDEPSVGVMNRIGLEFNAVGNHEFDRGWQELRRLQNGGCAKNTRLEPCQLEQFEGAHYKYLAASTVMPDGTTLFPGTGLKTFGSGDRKITIGFIGLSLKSIPTLVAPDRRERPQVRGRGGHHQPRRARAQGGGRRCRGRADPPGPAHQGRGRSQRLQRSRGRHPADPRPPEPRRRRGRLGPHPLGLYLQLHRQCRRRSDPADQRRRLRQARYRHHARLRSGNAQAGEPAGAQPDRPVGRLYFGQGPGDDHHRFPQFQPRADISAYVKRYKDASLQLVERPVGHVSGPMEKESEGGVGTGGSLGALIADSQLAATRKSGAQIAFVNPFGIRTSLVPRR